MADEDKIPEEINLPEQQNLRHLSDEERAELAARLTKEQKQEEVSLREGFRYLFRSTMQFIFLVVAGAAVILVSRDVADTNRPAAVLMVLAGVVLIIKGMMSLGGFNAK